MKKFLFLILLPAGAGLHAQNDSRALAADPNFVKMVETIAIKQLETRDNLKFQLQQNYSTFCRAMKTYTTDQQVDALIAQYQVNTESSYDAMSEHLTHQYMLVKDNPWLEGMSTTQRRAIVLAAYDEGMNSTDQLWVSLKQDLVARTQAKGTANKTVGQVIAGCVRETVSAAFNIAEHISAAVFAIQRGSFWGTVKAIKNILKQAGTRLGWWGLVAAAWDIGSCIYNEL